MAKKRLHLEVSEKDRARMERLMKNQHASSLSEIASRMIVAYDEITKNQKAGGTLVIGGQQSILI